MEWNKNQILEAIKPNILERLNAPLTAIFCSPDELILEEKRNGGNWEVRGTLNSQNKFGALLKANFSFSIVFFKFDKRRKACRGARPSADMRIIPVPDRCPNPPICGRPSSVWPEASRPASTHRFRLRRSAPP